MPLTPDESLRLKLAIATRLDEIAGLFQPGAKVTCVVRHAGRGDAGVVVTNDDLDLVVEEIRRRQADPETS